MQTHELEAQSNYLGTFISGDFSWRMFESRDHRGPLYLCILSYKHERIGEFQRRNMSGIDSCLQRFLDDGDER